MKRIFLIALLPLLFAGCLGVRTEEIAMPPEAFIPTPTFGPTPTIHEIVPVSTYSDDNPPTPVPGCDEEKQTLAVNEMRAVFGLPDLPLTNQGVTQMINSPSGDLAVVEYFDGDGRLFYVSPQYCQVVEMDARSLLSTIPEDTAAAPYDDVKAQAFEAAALVTDQDISTLDFQEGGKVDNYFFVWYGVMPAGAMNPIRIQMGYHESGLLFAYMNTIGLEP